MLLSSNMKKLNFVLLAFLFILQFFYQVAESIDQIHQNNNEAESFHENALCSNYRWIWLHAYRLAP